MKDDVQKLSEFYRDKRVLLTGNTGFKGTWMNLLLEALGCTEVLGYALPIEEGAFYTKVKPITVRQVQSDIAEHESVHKAVQEFQPDIILHLASHSSLRGSMEIPDFILRTNIMGVENILEAARVGGCAGSVVIVTSDKCYDEKDLSEPFFEASAMGADDPYGTSKVCQELLAHCYQKTFFEGTDTGIATARASNCIGPGDGNEARLFPYLLNCYTKGDIPKLRHPEAIRSWQYVLDVGWGYLLLAKAIYENPGLSGAYNFGPDGDGYVSVGEVADQVADSFGTRGYRAVAEAGPVKNETSVLRLDSNKAEKVLGWKRRVVLQEAVQLTAEYTKQAMRGIKEADLARKMVQDYMGV